MPKLTIREQLMMFFAGGLLLGILCRYTFFGGLGILLAMLVLKNK